MIIKRPTGKYIRDGERYDALASSPEMQVALAARMLEEGYVLDPLTREQLLAVKMARDARKIWDGAKEFLDELTTQEAAGFALSTHPVLAMMRLKLSCWSSEVWSDHPDVLAALAVGVSEGILTEERKLQILTK